MRINFKFSVGDHVWVSLRDAVTRGMVTACRFSTREVDPDYEKQLSCTSYEIKVWNAQEEEWHYVTVMECDLEHSDSLHGYGMLDKAFGKTEAAKQWQELQHSEGRSDG